MEFIFIILVSYQRESISTQNEFIIANKHLTSTLWLINIALKSIHIETVARQPYWNQEVCMCDTRDTLFV